MYTERLIMYKRLHHKEIHSYKWIKKPNHQQTNNQKKDLTHVVKYLGLKGVNSKIKKGKLE